MRSNRDEFDKTQKMNKLDQTIVQPQGRTDIEVKDTAPQSAKKEAVKNKFKFLHGRKFKIGILTVVFLTALAGGFYLSSYYHEKKDLAENESMHTQQELKKQQQLLEEQRRQLEDERKNLEREKEAMHSGSGQASSWLESAVDSIKDSVGNNSADAKKDSSQIDDKIAQAQQKIDEVDDNLGRLGTVKGKAMQIQGQVSQAYYNNKDIIDSIKYRIEKFLQ